MGWQCHQLDHMQIICTSLQTDNHTSTEYLNTQFLQAGCPSCRPTNWWSIKLDYYYYYNYSIKRGGERTWLAVSAREWMNSENMLCEPVYNHAIHFIIQLVALLQITTDQQLIQQMPYFLTIYRRKKRLLKLCGAVFMGRETHPAMRHDFFRNHKSNFWLTPLTVCPAITLIGEKFH